MRVLKSSVTLDESKEGVHDDLMTMITKSIPIPFEPAEEPVFASDLTIIPFIEHCSEMLDMKTNALGEMVKLSRELSDSEQLCEYLKGISALDSVNQFFVVVALQNQVFRGNDLASTLWPIVSDVSWWEDILENVESYVISHIMETIMIVRLQTRNEWDWELPQLFAYLCSRDEHSSMRENLFLSLIMLCIASDSISAFMELLDRESKDQFATIIEEYKSKFRCRIGPYPRWIEGRIRALLTALS